MMNLSHIAAALLASATASAPAPTPTTATGKVEAAKQPPAAQFFLASVTNGDITVELPHREGEADPTNAIPHEETTGLNDERVPERVRALEVHAVVLTSGRVDNPERIGFGSGGGASDVWWTALYKTDAQTGVGLGIINAPAGASLRAPTPVKIKTPEGERWAEATRAVLDDQLSPLDRTRFGRKVLSQARLAVTTGTFPNGGSALVTVNVPLRSNDPTAEPRSIAGAFVLDADGALVTVIQPPKTGGNTFEVSALGDIDADGFDDVLYNASYSEGAYQHLVRWAGDTASDTVIGGDGA